MVDFSLSLIEGGFDKSCFGEGGNGACIYIYRRSCQYLDIYRGGCEECDFDEGDNSGDSACRYISKISSVIWIYIEMVVKNAKSIQ